MTTRNQNKVLIAIAILMAVRSMTMAGDPAPGNDRKIQLDEEGRAVTVNLAKIADDDPRQYEIARMGIDILLRKIKLQQSDKKVGEILSPSQPLPADWGVDFTKVAKAEAINGQLELVAELAQAIAKANRKRVEAIHAQHHVKSIAEFAADPRFPH